MSGIAYGSPARIRLGVVMKSTPACIAPAIKAVANVATNNRICTPSRVRGRATTRGSVNGRGTSLGNGRPVRSETGSVTASLADDRHRRGNPRPRLLRGAGAGRREL